MMSVKNEIFNIISDICSVAISRLKLDVPLHNQIDINSLDCAEIELLIQQKLDLNFDSFSVVSKNLSPNQIIDNVQKLLELK